ncbi:MAG: hypothetical protein M3071_05100 [Actinomycetota bacterium]|nr:hypothetical protein [Actinomycetota bacterium]
MDSPLYLSLLVGPLEALPAPKALVDAFVSAEVTESATESSGFQITFTLADRSLLQTFLLLTAGSSIPFLRVILTASIGGGLPEVIVDGLIEHHEVQPDAMRGNSKLVVSGRDMRVLMGLIELTGLPYPAMSPDLRVLLMLAKYAPFGIVPEVIPVPVPDISVPIEQIPVQRGTDLTYIEHLASEAGYVFYIVPGPVPGINQAYWGPQVRIGTPQPALNVNMDSWTNVESLTFKYQPQGSVLPIVFMQESLSGVTVPIPIPPVTPFNPPLGVAVPIPQQVHELDDTAKRSPAEALMLGIAEAVKHADVVTVNGTLDVTRYGQLLRARSLVGVRGAGLAFDGMHYVDSVTHSVKPGEYKQSFVLKRNALISDLPTVPTAPY